MIFMKSRSDIGWQKVVLEQTGGAEVKAWGWGRKRQGEGNVCYFTQNSSNSRALYLL